MNLDSLDDSFFKTSAIPVFQRLGYILEHVVERADLAETLYSKIEVAGLKFRMIPEFATREWSEHVPWTESEQVEQDLLICRALTEIYKDEYLASHLAFRGGTALHKLFLSPQPRYSEDIDLVQINAEPIKETYDHIRDALAFLGERK